MMQPQTIKIEKRQVRIRPGHESDREVLLWIDKALPHVSRYLGQRLHCDITDWLGSYAEGIWFADIDYNQDGFVRLADPVDAERFNKAFQDRLW